MELLEAEEDSLTRLSPRDSNYIAISSLQAKSIMTASSTNASSSLQTALSKLPDHAMSKTARFCVSAVKLTAADALAVRPKSEKLRKAKSQEPQLF